MSLGITNLASIRTNHIYHHCYEFGTTSVFMAMGNTREVPKRKGDEIVFEKCMPIGVTMRQYNGLTGDSEKVTIDILKEIATKTY